MKTAQRHNVPYLHQIRLGHLDGTIETVLYAIFVCIFYPLKFFMVPDTFQSDRWRTYSHKFSILYIPSSNNPALKRNHCVYDLINAFLKETGQALFHHGSYVTEYDKVNAIASNDLFTEALRICWENPTRSYNCGRCPNCTRKDDPIKTVARCDFKTTQYRQSPSLACRLHLYPTGPRIVWMYAFMQKIPILLFCYYPHCSSKIRNGNIIVTGTGADKDYSKFGEYLLLRTL